MDAEKIGGYRVKCRGQGDMVTVDMNTGCHDRGQEEGTMSRGHEVECQRKCWSCGWFGSRNVRYGHES